MRRALLLWIFATALASSHCAFFGGGSNENLKRALGYKLSVPTEWKNIDKQESDAAYRLPSGVIMEMTSSCTRHHDASLEILTKQLLIGTRNIHIEKQEKISISNGTGLLTELTTSHQGSIVYLSVIVFSERGCVFDFSLLGNRKFSDSERSQFVQLARSLQYAGN